MSVNKATLELIKKWEGFRAEAYLCPANVWTIGYGTTAAAGVGISPKRGMKVTEAQASAYLAKTVDKFATQVRGMVKVPVNENQFGALVSLAYNIGPGAFVKSTLLRKLNDGDYPGAADQFRVWNKAGGKVLAGLTNRRKEERALFVSAPTPAAKVGGLWAIILKLLGMKK